MIGPDSNGPHVVSFNRQGGQVSISLNCPQGEVSLVFDALVGPALADALAEVAKPDSAFPGISLTVDRSEIFHGENPLAVRINEQ